MYGMKRTTVYLPDDLKERLEVAAKTRGVTEAEIVRQAVDIELRRRAPRGGFLSGGLDDGVNSGNLHEHMEGFGEL